MSDNEPYIPKNPVSQGILSLFNDGDIGKSCTDITFDINNGEEKFYAHRCILQGCAPTLAEYCDGCKDDNNVVSMKDMKPGIFRHLLYYVYGGTISNDVLEENAIDLIDVADKFGVGHLKVVAEVYYVKSTDITMDNFTENFNLADTKKCALLKEKVMDFLVENDAEALKHLSSKDKEELPQSQNMITDILTAMIRGKRKRDEDVDPGVDTMSVNEMRKKLDHIGLSVDGTREMLIEELRRRINFDVVVVEGSGIHGANGTYRRDGDHSGASKYTKSGQFEGEDKIFTICRFRFWRFWRISVWRGRDDNSDLLLYKSNNYNKSNNWEEITLPTGEWNLDEHGEPYAPAPNVSFGTYGS